MSAIVPSRIQIARERRGLLAKELAEVCGVTPPTVTHWEGGISEPSAEMLAQIAKATGFQLAFFYKEAVESPSEDSVTFRARTRIPARSKRSALAASVLARELASWIEARFTLPKVDLPDLSGQPPDLVARVVRAEWTLGIKPIPGMIRLLESRGILILSLAENVHQLDAFSFWYGERPIVMLNTMKSPERSRGDAGHELFHLLCHKEKTDKKEEDDANRFAGALLMPEDDLRQHIQKYPSLQQLIIAKQRWGVSLAALVYRLHEISAITDWHYRSLFMQLSGHGYRTDEPNQVPRDSSALLGQVFDYLAQQGIKPGMVANELGWGRKHLQDLIFGLGAALLPVDGGQQPNPTTRPRTGRNGLRLLDPTEKSKS